MFFFSKEKRVIFIFFCIFLFVFSHFHTFLASISQDILHLSEIMEIKENVKRVQFIEKTVKFKGFYESIAEGQQQLSKSLINADWSREEGNKLYREEHFLPAIEKFNASICFAPDDSHQLGKAYGNRSAAYFSIKMYDLCLKNIRLARKNNLPEKLMLKLNEREKKCLQEMQKSKSSSDIVFNGVKPELSFPVHDTVPFIANCLELRNKRRYGRHIVSNTELKVGDIVAIEPPFCSVASSSIQHIACANCFRENDLDLIPCRGCHSVMFCNEECYKQAVDAFHDIECPIINVLCSSIINAAQNVAIRLLILAVKSFNTVDELIQFVKDVENNENNAFTVDYQNNEKLGLLAAILKFDSYEGKSLPFVINTSAVVAVAYKLLLQHTGFKDLFKTKAQINFLIGFFYHLCEIANTNSVQSATMISIQWNIDTIGIRLKARTEMFPFSNLFNHSCAPNVTRVKHGLKSVIIVTKPIAEGEQLFLCYG